jgi:hypothetical protein
VISDVIQWFVQTWAKILPVVQSEWMYMIVVALITCLVVYGLDKMEVKK